MLITTPGRESLFVYGRLLDPAFRRIALGETPTPFRPAILNGYRTVQLEGNFKNLEPYPGNVVEGRVLCVRPDGLHYLDELSGGIFERRPIVVVSNGEEINTQTYFMREGALLPARLSKKIKQTEADVV